MRQLCDVILSLNRFVRQNNHVYVCVKLTGVQIVGHLLTLPSPGILHMKDPRSHSVPSKNGLVSA